MTEPSERDFQKAHDLYFNSRFLTPMEKAKAIAQAIAAAREEGRELGRILVAQEAGNLVRRTCRDALAAARAEERGRCAKIAKWFADDECWDQGGVASLILRQIEDPLYDPAA